MRRRKQRKPRVGYGTFLVNFLYGWSDSSRVSGAGPGNDTSVHKLHHPSYQPLSWSLETRAQVFNASFVTLYVRVYVPKLARCKCPSNPSDASLRVNISMGTFWKVIFCNLLVYLLRNATTLRLLSACVLYLRACEDALSLSSPCTENSLSM